MRAFRRLGLTLLVGLPLTGVLAWRVVSAVAAPFSVRNHAMNHSRQVGPSRTRLLSLCTAGFESISPCTASTTVYVHGGGTKVFQLQNNSSFDDILIASCTKPGVVSACSVTPGIDTVKAGRSKNVTLNFTAGAAGGAGVILIDASGNVDLEATDTIT